MKKKSQKISHNFYLMGHLYLHRSLRLTRIYIWENNMEDFRKEMIRALIFVFSAIITYDICEF